MRTFIIILAAIILFSLQSNAQNCGTMTSECATASIENMIEYPTHTEITVRISIDENCYSNQAVSHVSFGLPQGVEAISPSESEAYNSSFSARDYDVENMSNNPFHSIKFNTGADFEGVKPGEEDYFTFTIPAGITITEMPVEVKTAGNSNIFNIAITDECKVNALPVELSSFYGNENDGDVDLEWSTASEENSSHFEVQKSTNGNDWEVIGKVESNHNSAEENYYSFTDNKVRNTTNYYRLRMVDFDASYEFSDIIKVTMEEIKASVQVKAFPNPTIDYLNIELNADNATEINIRLTNVAGNTLQQRTASNDDNVQFDMNSLPSGIYFLVVDNGTDVQTQKIVKK